MIWFHSDDRTAVIYSLASQAAKEICEKGYVDNNNEAAIARLLFVYLLRAAVNNR